MVMSAHVRSPSSFGDQVKVPTNCQENHPFLHPGGQFPTRSAGMKLKLCNHVVQQQRTKHCLSFNTGTQTSTTSVTNITEVNEIRVGVMSLNTETGSNEGNSEPLSLGQGQCSARPPGGSSNIYTLKRDVCFNEEKFTPHISLQHLKISENEFLYQHFEAVKGENNLVHIQYVHIQFAGTHPGRSPVIQVSDIFHDCDV